ncbi:MAG: hypothetical protein HQL54_01650 [Magnetococcales bacterium]|nr:hypothetical protein [Magnetococcales bacterium]
MSFFAELWLFLRVRKKFWLLPILLMMILLGGILIFAQGSAVAPFIYTLF